jgi:hypothetical protein
MTTSKSPLVAVPSDALPDGTCGLITFWRLGGSVAIDALAAAWRAADLPDTWLPSGQTPATALKRTLDHHVKATGRRYLVRPVVPGQEWHVVEERVLVGADIEEDRSLSYDTVFTARLTAIGGLRLTGNGLYAGHVREDFEFTLARLSDRDLSSWLPRLVDRLDAVPLRPSGGVYFVPPSNVCTWDAVRQLLSAASGGRCAIERIPAMRSADSARAILTGLVDEARAQIAAIVEDLSRAEITHRGIDTRREQLAALSAKIQRYEALMGEVAAGFGEAAMEGEAALLQAYARAAREEDAA